MIKHTNRRVAAALRAEDSTVVVGVPRRDDNSNFWVIGDAGHAVAVNCQTFSVLGRGCIDHPDYVTMREALVQKAIRLLTAAGISFERSRTPDQLFLNGYKPVYR